MVNFGGQGGEQIIGSDFTYIRKRFAMPGQVAKSHWERLSAATKNGKSCCSHSIYQLQRRMLANHGHLCHILPPLVNGFWLTSPALQIFMYKNILSHLEWFSFLLAPRNWTQISHPWYDVISSYLVNFSFYCRDNSTQWANVFCL